VAAFGAFSASKELLLALKPETSPQRVRSMQAATSEAARLLAGRPGLSIGAAHDIRPLAGRASLGAILTPSELLDILSTIEAGRSMRALLHRGQLVYPELATYTGRLHALKGLHDGISAAMNDRAEVVDSASPQLMQLRREVRAGRDRIMRRLEAVIAENPEAIQEPIITERNGRYVIAVKAGERHRIRGVVHDQSESGATLFLEPLATVDMTNDWRQHQLDEQKEIERILRLLSNQVALEAGELTELVEALAGLDAVFAKARYAQQIKAIEPHLNADGVIDLVDARHPLLTGRVVPQTIRLGHDYRVLVITGPNTGGKTVALKTAGLLTLMAQCGLHIPAAAGSKVAVFEQVLADIGDEQSIEQSLSTFSGHLRNIVGMLETAGPKSLVVLDELGAGTDPDEGSELARAILEYLLERGITTIVATHYSELKAFAHNHEGVENASVEFDANTLSPTYRLRIGTPGRSNALAIAARLGLPREIIDNARGGLSEEHLRAESLLEQIHRKERAAARERNRAARAEQQQRRLRAQAAENLAEAERLRQEARDRAQAEAEAELANLRREAARLAQELQRARHDRAAVQAIQAELVQTSQQLEQRRRSQVQPSTKPVAPASLAIGDHVRVPGFTEPGQVLTLPNSKGELEVQVGAFNVRARAAELQPAPRPRPREAGYAFQRAPGSLTPPSLSHPVDMRGVRAEDVEPLLDRELNEAFSAGQPYLKIIHGHGSGIVRRMVRDYLAQQAYVSSFEPAPPGEGGDGATIVTLAL
jgi:DNA mismatch repair protein MutS2